MISAFIVGLLELTLINIVLSGDNAVVIALACRKLPKEQQLRAIFWGSFGAIALRVGLTFVAVFLLTIPLLKIIGALLLVWIAINLLDSHDEEEQLKGSANLMGAIRTIIVADLVMSLDNVVAVAGAANGNILLIIIGLAISIPLIVFGSQILMFAMKRYPIIITFGAALLGYTAGEMIFSDAAIDQWVNPLGSTVKYGFALFMAVLVVVAGKLGSLYHEKSAKLKKHVLSKNEGRP